jgi:two-component system sensor histidine kinase CpxA
MLSVSSRFTSIGAKLFICFWLIVILTIGITRLVSEQFRPKSFIAPSHHSDIRRLKRIKNSITRRTITSPQEILAILPKHVNEELLIKNMLTKEVISLQTWRMSNLINFLSENSLDSLTTVKFEFFRMTGPIAITINDTAYQVFLASRDRKFRFGSFMLRIPTWIRISIPVIISSIFLWLLTRSLTKPLIAMQKTAARFGDGELTVRVPLAAQRNDEIGACAASFNLMAEKLEQNIGSHQRLMADVSHELRSPMTRLQIALGLAQQEKITPDLLQKHLLRCELEVARLDEMISSVLSLSRMENTISQMELMSVDLKQLIELCIEDAQYIANEKSIIISLQGNDIDLTQADPNLLSSAFNNILVNAVKYSHVNDELKVCLTQKENSFIIDIIDTGTGVPAEDLSRLFEPFYRVAQARDRATGGTGLGMAIAKQAIIAHNGDIKAKNNSESGLTVTIELPMIVDNRA